MKMICLTTNNHQCNTNSFIALDLGKLFLVYEDFDISVVSGLLLTLKTNTLIQKNPNHMY